MKRALTTSLAAVVLLAGCGSDDEPAAPSGGGDVVEVGMEQIEFVPKQVDVKVGQTVRWTNGESIVHNVSAEEGADFRSENLQEGETFEYKPTEAGTIEYVCTIHPGQNGTLTVK